MAIRHAFGTVEREAERAGVTNFFRRTLDSLVSHIAVLRCDGEILVVNAAWKAFASSNGLTDAHCGPGVNYLRICEAASGPSSEEAGRIASAIREVGVGRLPGFELEYPCRSPVEERWFLVRITRFVAVSRVYIVVTHDDVTQRKRIEMQLQEANRLLQAQATTDELTGLGNRRHFDQVLAREWGRHARAGSPLSVLLIDVDRFKMYNDSRGHRAGDDCLREVALTIHEAVSRPGDFAARYGGEEFAAVLPDTGRDGALAMARRLGDRIRRKRIPHGSPGAGPILTVSVGCATMTPDRHESADEILARADRALYEAKTAGRDRAIHAG